jgi:hypothetical protein
MAALFIYVMLFPFLKYIFGIWDWGLAAPFWDHVFQISIKQMNLQFIFPSYEKLKSFVEMVIPYYQILIFDEHLFMSNMDFYVWY